MNPVVWNEKPPSNRGAVSSCVACSNCTLFRRLRYTIMPLWMVSERLNIGIGLSLWKSVNKEAGWDVDLLASDGGVIAGGQEQEARGPFLGDHPAEKRRNAV